MNNSSASSSSGNLPRVVEDLPPSPPNLTTSSTARPRSRPVSSPFVSRSGESRQFLWTVCNKVLKDSDLSRGQSVGRGESSA